jgi:hypothetical protein
VTQVSLLYKLYRRIRYGQPVVVVSGLPRSGTSMTMQMLEAGGLGIVADGLREADESNPQGYYELEQVKELDKSGDLSWLVDARGKAVKIVSLFLPHLPDSNNYKVIFMHRNLAEILASQAKMLERRGETSDTDDERMRELYIDHLAKAARVLASNRCFDILDVQQREAIKDPGGAAARMNRFLGGKLDETAMAAAVNPELHRNRVGS